MTIVSTAFDTQAVDNSALIVAELEGGQTSDVQMMIGIGVVKDSDAVFFEYVGDKQHRALTIPSTGKPLETLYDILLTGISVADDIGEFKATKLNLFVTTKSGHEIMITSGLTTLWSQCVMTGLLGLEQQDGLMSPFSLDTWKGSTGMRPCLAAIKVGRARISDQGMYDQFKDLRGLKNKVAKAEKLDETMRSAVNIIRSGLGFQEPIEPVTVETVDTKSEEGDF